MLARQHRHFSFLQLPREIRDHIYFHAFTTSVNPPDTPPQESLPGRHSRDQEGLVKNSIYYPIFSQPENCTGLLLANRQIHLECKEALLTLVERQEMVYKLDCLMTRLWVIYPSWLSVPAKLAKVSKLEVTYRVPSEAVTNDLLWDGNWLNSCISSSFQVLLREILLWGPNFMRLYDGEIETETSEAIKVGEVVLNVVTQFIMHEDGVYEYPGSVHGKAEAFHSTVTNPVRKRLSRWIRMGVPQCVFEKVNLIRYCVNGEEEKEWDIVAMSRGEYDSDS